MPETCGYFPGPSGTPLYGVFHPAGGADPKLGVVIAASLLEERKSAYGALTLLARELAAAGHPVLRFDYLGGGESGGAPAARSWQDLAEDLVCAVRRLSSLTGGGPVGLLGLRLGATVSLQYAARASGNVRAVVAIAPVVKGAVQARLWRMRSRIRAELTALQDAGAPAGATPQQSRTAGAAMDLDGFTVGAAFLDELAAVDLLRFSAPLACPTLVVQVSHRTDAAPESSQLASALGAQARLACVRLEPFWDRVDAVDTQPINQRVLEFLREVRPAAS